MLSLPEGACDLSACNNCNNPPLIETLTVSRVHSITEACWAATKRFQLNLVSTKRFQSVAGVSCSNAHLS